MKLSNTAKMLARGALSWLVAACRARATIRGGVHSGLTLYPFSTATLGQHCGCQRC